MKVIALCGTSGSGKSTAAKVLCPHEIVQKPVTAYNIIWFVAATLDISAKKARKLLTKYVHSEFEHTDPVSYVSIPDIRFTTQNYEFAFADVLKKIVCVVFSVGYDIVSGNVSKKLRKYRDSTPINTGYDKCSDLTTRELLIYTATFLRKELSDSLFVDIVMQRISALPETCNAVISDLRYNVEYEILLKKHIPIYRIIRDGYINTDEDYAHFTVATDIHNRSHTEFVRSVLNTCLV